MDCLNYENSYDSYILFCLETFPSPTSSAFAVYYPFIISPEMLHPPMCSKILFQFLIQLYLKNWSWPLVPRTQNQITTSLMFTTGMAKKSLCLCV